MGNPACDIVRAKRIVCFGDSVTQGVPHVAPADAFASLLERRLQERYGPESEICAVNAGVGGENTREALLRIEADVVALHPELVTVEFGLNDIRYEPDKRTEEAAFAANLREIHRRLDEGGAAVVFMTPTPIVNVFHVYSQGTDYYAPWGGCEGINGVYANIIRQVAADVQAPLCDIHAAFSQEAIKLEFRGETFDYRDLSVLSRYISSRDGVHPTAAGQEFIAAELYRVIIQGDLLATHV